MKHVRVHFVHLGAPQISTAAAIRFRHLVDQAWTVSASTIQHDTRENDSATQQALHASHIIVCMGKRTFDELEKRFDIDARKIMVWHMDRYSTLSIEKQCQELADYVREGSWVDTAYKDGSKTGLTLPASWVCDRGYWHLGVHVVLMTRSGDVVLEIRSKQMLTSPGTVDATLGGFVDAGETPEHAAVREIREELGIVIEPEQLHLLDVRNRSLWHPKHHKLSRSIIHAYMVVVDDANIVFRPEFSEVAGIALCTPRHLNRLLHGQNLKGLGTLCSPAYHNDIIRLARRKLKQYSTSRKNTK